MKRLIEKIVFCGLVTAWRLATVPTRRSPPCVNATTDGVVRPPSAFSTTVGSPPSSTAMHEFVVPRSIPIVLPMLCFCSCAGCKNLSRNVADLRQCQGSSRCTFAHLSGNTAGLAERVGAGTHAPQRAGTAFRALGVAGAAAVAQEVDVE